VILPGGAREGEIKIQDTHVDPFMDLLSDAGSIPAASTNLFFGLIIRKPQSQRIRLRELIVATENFGKLREIEESLQGIGVRSISLKALAPMPSIEEDGATFLENAFKKARQVAQQCGRLTIADDSGLEVDYLHGGPGVRSARFASEGASDADNNRKLLRLLSGIPAAQRGATFRCVIAIVDPQGKERWVQGECRGVILEQARGQEGFGYDPLFFIPDLDKTLAELPLAVKNRVSHRGRALTALQQALKDFL
jgi:XTP/dITP diphosphohydrolase